MNTNQTELDVVRAAIRVADDCITKEDLNDWDFDSLVEYRTRTLAAIAEEILEADANRRKNRITFTATDYMLTLMVELGKIDAAMNQDKFVG